MIRVLRAILTILGIAATQSAQAATYVVTNVLDNGPGSLREAILNANANGGPDLIHFSVGSGPQTIALTQILPDVTGPTVIDGRTQPGYAGIPLIVVNGTSAPQGQHGLKVTGGSSEIRALVINGFPAQFLLGGGHGIVLENGGSNLVSGCYIGTNAQGTAALSNAGDGVRIVNSSGNRIGETVPDDTALSNLLSGNSNGVAIYGTSNDNLVTGNFIGTNVGATAAIGNGINGISVFSGTNNCIGCPVVGNTFAGRNVISGNLGDGVFVAAPQTSIRRNLIGWRPLLEGVLPNDGDGIEVNGVAGGQIVQNQVAGNTFNGILVFSGATGVTVEQNSTGSRGIAGAGNTLNGILVSGANGNTVRGNVVGGNGTNGIRIRSGSSGNTVTGNFVGVGAALSDPVPNLDDGIEINDGATNNVVGGLVPADGNVVVFNGANGILITDATATGNSVLGNTVGIRFALPAANTLHGIAITNGASGNAIGGIAPGSGNTIWYNGGAGVFVESGTGNPIRGNHSHLNGTLGIDLAPAGVNANDPLDPDAGPNLQQNFPVLNAVIGVNGVTTVTGTLSSLATSTFQIDFYASGSCDGSGNGEGTFFLGSAEVTTDGAGDASIGALLPVVSPGRAITATATDSAGNTSELSACIFTPLPVVSQLVPDNGPAAGGTPVTITGQTFQTGASVKVGGQDATNVTVNGPTSIGAETPVLSPGTLNDLLVRNPDGQPGTLVKAFLADFIDVPQAHGFHDFVEAIFRAGVTAGCGFGYFCVDQAVPRDQMAVFLLIAKNGSAYVPPPATGTVFLDVPASAFAAAFIEALSAAGVTAGCGGNNYCPADPVTRAQMSVMILRTLEGSMYFPPPATGTVFTDVPASAFAAAWIEEMADRGITSGCGGGNFCPDLSTTRGQMAVFLTVAFML